MAHIPGEMGKAAGFAGQWLNDFKVFLTKNNVLGLAIGVVIGAAVGKVVSGIVDDLIMPIIGVILPGGEWRNAAWTLQGTNAIKYGDLIGRLIDFTIVAFVVFLIIKAFVERGKPVPASAPATRPCPECLDTIPAAARVCHSCGSAVGAIV